MGNSENPWINWINPENPGTNSIKFLSHQVINKASQKCCDLMKLIWPGYGHLVLKTPKLHPNSEKMKGTEKSLKS